MRIVSRIGATVLTIAALTNAQAASLFSITVDVAGQVNSASFSSIEEMFDALSSSGLRNINTGYTGTQAATVSINLRGLPVIISYPTANSTVLIFQVPSLGISQTFQGTSRDMSQDQLEDFLKKNGSDILSRIGREQARVSPVDPVAGNPGSLMTQLVMQNFHAGFTDFATNIAGERTEQAAGATGAIERVNNLFGLGLRYSQYRQDGLTSRTVTVPLSYTFRNDLDPRRQTSFSLPITLSDVEGAKSYHVGLGFSHRFPVSDDWALMPAATLAAAGSRDMGSLAAVGSASLTSSYLFRVGGMDLAMGNMVGYYTTIKVASGDYSYNPDIKNTVLRNGLILSHPVSTGGGTFTMEYSFTDTYFAGDELYIKRFDEIGISIGTNKSARSSRSYMRGGASYLHSSKSKGFSAYFNYYF